MRWEQWLVFAALAAAGTQRLAETFARREKVSGAVKMAWSFYAFFALHTLILVGSFAEFMLAGRKFSWISFGAGVILYAGAMMLRQAAIRELGKFWSLQVEIREQHRLVTTGVYAYVRHPAYAAIIFEVISLPILASAWWTLAAAVVTYIPLLMWRMMCEERELAAKFGDAYERYRKQVRALVPIRRQSS
jgi:protein-S-isoprenylcysteine O-methyltransferase Ste14